MSEIGSRLKWERDTGFKKAKSTSRVIDHPQKSSITAQPFFGTQTGHPLPVIGHQSLEVPRELRYRRQLLLAPGLLLAGLNFPRLFY